jgi:hypothetical protein
MDRGIRKARAGKRGLALIKDVPKVIPKCPMCGQADYLFQTDTKAGSIECEGIACKKCGADILDAYRRTAR